VCREDAGYFSVESQPFRLSGILRLLGEKQEIDNARHHTVQNLDLLHERRGSIGTRMLVLVNVHVEMPRVILRNRGLRIEKRRAAHNDTRVCAHATRVVLLFDRTGDNVCRRAAHVHDPTRSAAYALAGNGAPYVRVTSVHGGK